MLATLRRAHAELGDALAGLERVVADSSPDRCKLADARLKLSRASAARSQFLELHVYPHLLKSTDSAATRSVRELRSEGLRLRAASGVHVSHWSVEKAVSDWAGYQSASKTMRASMRRRIVSEKAILYPLLGDCRDDQPRSMSKDPRPGGSLAA